MEPWIVRMCRQASRRQLAAWVIFLLVGLAFVALNARYVINFAGGPFPMKSDELAQVTTPESAPHYFVSVVSEKVIDTGIQEVTTTTRSGTKVGSRVSAGYYAVLVGDRFLVVKSSTAPLAKIEGELKPLPSELSSRLFSGPEGREIQAIFYPFYLDSEGFRYPGYWGVGISLVFLALFFKYARSPWSHLRDISKHPVVQRLYGWGDPIGTSFSVEQELSTAARFKVGGYSLTDNYIVSNSFFAFNVLRFQDLLWAYKQVTSHYSNFIPTGKTYNAVMIFYGGAAEVGAKEEQANELLQYAASKAPWAIFGHSKELEELFTKKTEDFCVAVELRRREAASGS